jgi:hypothetical protein
MIAARPTRNETTLMKADVSVRSLRRAVLPALASGIVAGTLIVAMIAFSSRVSPLIFFRGVSAIALGHSPLAPATAALVGALLHYAVSIGWAFGYTLLAQSTPQLVYAPLVSGLSFGIIVEITMDGLLVMTGSFHLPSPSEFLREIIAHTIGFGVPLAFIVARSLRPITPPAVTQ